MSEISANGEGPGEAPLYYRLDDEQYEELAEFAHCVETGAAPSVNGLHAFNVAAYFEAIEESVNTERAARFRPFDE